MNTPPPIVWKQCANCHERDLAKEFTFDWCDACAEAFIKGAVSAFAAGVGTFLVGLVLRFAGQLW